MSTDRIPKVGEVWTTPWAEVECCYVNDDGALWRWPLGTYVFYGTTYVQERWTPPKEPLPELMRAVRWVDANGALWSSPGPGPVAKITIRRTADGQGYDLITKDLR